jgi:hypothetical protein
MLPARVDRVTPAGVFGDSTRSSVDTNLFWRKTVKKLFALLAAAALLTAVKPATARADGAQLGLICQVSKDPNETVGDCTKRIATIGPAWCKAIDNSTGGPNWAVTFKSQGECVAFIQQAVRSGV